MYNVFISSATPHWYSLKFLFLLGFSIFLRHSTKNGLSHSHYLIEQVAPQIKIFATKLIINTLITFKKVTIHKPTHLLLMLNWSCIIAMEEYNIQQIIF